MKIVADASAVLAVLKAEPDADQYLCRVLIACVVWMSSINWWEVQVRIYSRPARLNLGDCFACALARSKGVPLLYKGSDFTETDLKPA